MCLNLDLRNKYELYTKTSVRYMSIYCVFMLLAENCGHKVLSDTTQSCKMQLDCGCNLLDIETPNFFSDFLGFADYFSN